ncbi:WYL domain-containing protein [Vibrio parahaemolyticus]|uniref:helix-turn-helix transcriptional regulator n=1 Tax=Vibrio TaxID=662 RepID=UPI00094181D2|nr:MULTISPECIES: WYL domain-containing protein [Vibrio]AWG80691.1 WYL domain-containing protein [Vibrio parahaemolyticus]AWJ81621.1 WYL domain-containing protein [Vibrio parahaemolyticus]EHK0048677.1 WYL domain-containing protein [Vibrio parahaemolyticus]EJG0989130.1 WYL domain-containing protein [Vibrio parahaemolyticus]EKL9828590.1 WYL domain-containing protein [Vibrio alginolyticus]
MAKRSSTNESLVIAFELLKRIPRSHQVTARELHCQLEEVGILRDLRSVQRSLEMLCDHFDILRDDRTKPYGYRWNKGSESLSLPKLSSVDALLLSLAQEHLKYLLPANLTSSLDGFFQEAKYQLNPTSGSTKDREWLKKVAVVSETLPLLPPKIDSLVFRKVSDALYHNRYLTIDYVNASQTQKSSMVMPLGLAQQGQRLYLVCRFDGYDNERTIAIHRIKKATVSTFEFERPKEFKLSQYYTDGRFGFGEGDKCSIRFCIAKQTGFYLKETPLSSDQTLEEHPDYFVVTATVIKSKQLDRWLSGFGNLIWDVGITDHEYETLT